MVNDRLDRTCPQHGRGPLLLGVRRGQSVGRGLGRKLAERGEIAYWAAPPEDVLSRNRPSDRRAQARVRIHLRSAKLLDGGYRFLCESGICDRSCGGLRLTLARDTTLPRALALHIDETSEVRAAQIIWRRGLTIGLHLGAAVPEDALRPFDRNALRERYYAIPN